MEATVNAFCEPWVFHASLRISVATDALFSSG